MDRMIMYAVMDNFLYLNGENIDEDCKIPMIKALREWSRSNEVTDPNDISRVGFGLKTAKDLIEKRVAGLATTLGSLLRCHPNGAELAKVLNEVKEGLICYPEQDEQKTAREGIDLTKYTLNQLYGENGILKKDPIAEPEINTYPIDEHPFFD